MAVHRTNIEWCDFAVNPLRAEFEGQRGWGCVKTSPGCVNCYSEAIDTRFGIGQGFNSAANRKVTHYLDEKALLSITRFRPRGPFKNNRDRPSVFPCDMTDMFGEWVPDEHLDRIFAAFALRPDADFLCLTKRAERMHQYVSKRDRTDYLYAAMEDVATKAGIADFLYDDQWPLPNVWLGVSAEDQQRADERIPVLLKTPAAVRFLSCEPLLEPIDLRQLLRGIGWVIVGGESGPGARPCDPHWIRTTVTQCRRARVPVFVKQLGGNVQPRNDEVSEWLDECGISLDDVDTAACRMQGDPVRVRLADKKGGDMAEWPSDLRVREMPEAAHV